MSASLVFTRKSRSRIASDKAIIVDDSHFADGEPNFFIPDLEEVTGRCVVYYADWSTPKERYNDLCFLVAIAETQPSMLRIIIPFSATATMEREVLPGSIATANVDAKLLSALPCSKQVVMVDLHTLQNKFFFHNTAVRLGSVVPALVEKMMVETEIIRRNFRDPLILFPDDGALKRFGWMFPKLDIGACAKKRSEVVGEEDKRIVVLQDPKQVQGRNVIIADDLVRTGGTLIRCAEAAVAAGARQVGCVVPHAVFPEGSHAKFVGKDRAIHRFITTDSVVGAPEKLEGLGEDSPFEVVSLSELTVRGIVSGKNEDWTS